MYRYDMNSQADWSKLAAEAREKGRASVRHGVFATRSDQVERVALQECEQAFRVQPDSTNHPESYRTVFVGAFVDAYFDELVYLRNHMQPPLAQETSP